MSQLIELTDSNFESEVLKSDKPWLVDFWAEWCGPCLMVAPVMEEIAKEYAGKIKVGKLNVASNCEITAQYRIMSPPSFLFFNHGKVVDQIIGAVSKKQIVQKIEKILP